MVELEVIITFWKKNINCISVFIEEEKNLTSKFNNHNYLLLGIKESVEKLKAKILLIQGPSWKGRAKNDFPVYSVSDQLRREPLLRQI